MNLTINQLKKKIKTAKNIAVFCHSRPDADALSSMFVMVGILRKLNKNCIAVLEEEPKKKYDFMIGEFQTEFPKSCDLYISVDVAGKNMLGKFEKEFLEQTNTIEIDHHHNRDSSANFTYLEDNTSSCAEIVYKIAKFLKIKIDSKLSTIIYTGLAGDTGCFLHENTNSQSHKIACELIDLGADISFVNRRLFKSNTKNKLKLIEIALSKFEYYKDTLIVDISYNDFKSIGYNPNDGVDLIDFVSSIDGVNLTALLTERSPNNCSISFRSSNKYDVSILASKLGGGGHKGASGCKDLKGDISEIKKKLQKEIKLFIKEN